MATPALPYDRRDWLNHLFRFQGSVAVMIAPKVLLLTAISSLVTWLAYKDHLPQLPIAYFTVAGIAMGLMLAFRTNASYDRFWEGRKAWGSIVNRSRNLVRQFCTSCSAQEAHRAALFTAAFAHSAKRQLWREAEVPELVRLLGEKEAKALQVAPGAAQRALFELGNILAEARRGGKIDSIDHARLELDIATLIDQLGVCERIHGTPIPLVFVIYLRRLIIGYCLTIPLALHEPFGWFTPVGVGVLAYVFLGIDRAGVEIEDPFERTINDIDLEGISAKIEHDVLALAPKRY